MPKIDSFTLMIMKAKKATQKKMKMSPPQSHQYHQNANAIV